MKPLRVLAVLSGFLILTLVGCSTQDETEGPTSFTDLSSNDPFAEGKLPEISSVNQVTCEPRLQASADAEVSYLDLNVADLKVQSEPDVVTGLRVSWKPLSGASTHYLFIQKGRSGFSLNVSKCQSMTLNYDPGLVDSLGSSNGCDFYGNWFSQGQALTLTLSAGTQTQAEGKSGATSVVPVTIGSAPPAPPALSGVLSGSDAQLSWNAVIGASSYEVAQLSSGALSVVSTVTGTSTTLSGASSGDTFLVRAVTNAGARSAYSNALSITSGTLTFSVEKLTVAQAVEVSSTSNTTLIAGKPGIVRAYFNVTSGAGQTGTVELKHGDDFYTLHGPLLHTPYSSSVDAACVATFDLRDDATSWFQAGTQEFTVYMNSGTIIDNNTGTLRSHTESFTFEEQVPLYVKLVPISTLSGVPSPSQMQVAKVEIGQTLNAMYPNHSILIDVAGTPFQFLGTAQTGNDWESILSGLSSYRTVELGNQNCNRFYYGLLASGETYGGLAYVSGSDTSGCNLDLTGIGLVQKHLVGKIAAHELGHNHGRHHVDHGTNSECSAISGVDPNYPNQTAHLDQAGYDYFKNRLLAPSSYYDIMSYCNRTWISDYNYRNLRSFQNRLPTPSALVAQARSTSDGGWLLSGTRNEDGEWSLDRVLSLGGSRSGEARARFQAVVTRTDGSVDVLPVQLKTLDHSPAQPFSIWVPGAASVSRVVLQDETGTPVFDQRLSTAARMAPAQASELDVQPLGSDRWELSPWPHGPRLVVRVRGSERLFVGNDAGTAPLEFTARSGDVLEVRAPGSGLLKTLTLP